MLILVLLFNAKIPSHSDETAAAAAFTLISLAAATHTAASSSSVIFKDSPQHLLPAFVTTNSQAVRLCNAKVDSKHLDTRLELSKMDV